MSQEEQFIQLIADVFKIDKTQITDEKTPEQIETWTSVSHMDLVSRFENSFKIQFEVEEISEMDSIGTMKTILRRHGVKV